MMNTRIAPSIWHRWMSRSSRRQFLVIVAAIAALQATFLMVAVLMVASNYGSISGDGREQFAPAASSSIGSDLDRPRRIMRFTWSTPRWGRTGNQKLLLLFALRLARHNHWVLCPPDISVGSDLMSVIALFDRGGWLALEREGLVDLNIINCRLNSTQKNIIADTKVDLLPELHPSQEKIQQMTAYPFHVDSEHIWYIGSSEFYPMFDSRSPELIRDASRALKPSLDVPEFVRSSVVAVHLRGGDIQKVCGGIEKWLVHETWSYACDFTTNIGVLEAAIEEALPPPTASARTRSRQGRARPQIYLATNLKKSSPAILQLKERYDVLTYEDVFGYYKNGDIAAIPADMAVLSQAFAFVGNMHSTFSTSIAPARGFERVYFVRNAALFGFLPPWMAPILAMAVFAAFTAFIYAKIKRKTSPSKFCLRALFYFMLAWSMMLLLIKLCPSRLVSYIHLHGLMLRWGEIRFYQSPIVWAVGGSITIAVILVFRGWRSSCKLNKELLPRSTTRYSVSRAQY